jgi:hypothetical protein
MDMKNRMLVMTAVAGCYLMTCAAGFAQKTTQHYGNDGDSNSVATVEARNISAASPAPAAEATRKAAAKTLPVAPVAKSDATAAPSLREAQENPYLLLTYHQKDESQMLVNPYKESPTKIFGPGWNTNIDALRNNPFAPGPAPAYVDLKTLSHAVAKLL